MNNIECNGIILTLNTLPGYHKLKQFKTFSTHSQKILPHSTNILPAPEYMNN
jgi:hypothetical protein